jgi:hypothetical protein
LKPNEEAVKKLFTNKTISNEAWVKSVNDIDVKLSFSTATVTIDDVKLKKLKAYKKLLRLVYNCQLRVNEGYMINKSLADLKTDIATVVKRSLLINQEQYLLPLYNDNDLYPYCRNTFYQNEYFDNFYNINKIDDITSITDPNCIENDNTLSGILLKLMKCKMGVNIDNLNFAIFTVINTTNNHYVNNPPSIPYINVNDLIYYAKVKPDKNKLRDEINKMTDKLKKYSFYEDFSLDPASLYDDKILTTAEEMITLIKNNNAPTLIGTLEAADSLKHLTFNDLVCSSTNNSDLNNLIGTIDTKITRGITDIGIIQSNIARAVIPDSELATRNKYLKYKTKYIKLKNKLYN